MDTLKTIGIAVLVGVVLIVGQMFLGNLTPKALGSLAGPDIPSPYLNWGGVNVTHGASGLQTGTTTVCAIQSPSATSTLETGGVVFDVSSTTASTITIAKATTAFATTTVIATSSIAANAQGFVSAATTTAVSNLAAGVLTITDRVFAPNTWLVVGMSGGTGTFSPVGRCQAVWTVYGTR